MTFDDLRRRVLELRTISLDDEGITGHGDTFIGLEFLARELGIASEAADVSAPLAELVVYDQPDTLADLLATLPPGYSVKFENRND